MNLNNFDPDVVRYLLHRELITNKKKKIDGIITQSLMDNQLRNYFKNKQQFEKKLQKLFTELDRKFPTIEQKIIVYLYTNKLLGPLLVKFPVTFHKFILDYIWNIRWNLASRGVRPYFQSMIKSTSPIIDITPKNSTSIVESPLISKELMELYDQSSAPSELTIFDETTSDSDLGKSAIDKPKNLDFYSKLNVGLKKFVKKDTKDDGN